MFAYRLDRKSAGSTRVGSRARRALRKLGVREGPGAEWSPCLVPETAQQKPVLTELAVSQGNRHSDGTDAERRRRAWGPRKGPVSGEGVARGPRTGCGVLWLEHWGGGERQAGRRGCGALVLGAGRL